MNKSGKYHNLFKNIGFLTIGNFATKIISFFLVPLYTAVLSTEEYGIYDLFVNTIAILVPVLTLDIVGAITRFALEEDSDKNSIWLTGIKLVVVSSVIILIGLLVNHEFKISVVLDNYAIYFILLYLSSAINSITLAFARGIDKVKEIAISGVIGTVTSIIFNILFLLPLHMGLKGYFRASIIGGIIQTIFLLVSINAWEYRNISMFDKNVEKRLVKFSTPLIANDVSWWINAVSDRYVITFMCGVAENGIYAMGSKIPAILQTMENIFEQAWTISSVKEFDKKDKNNYFSNLYNCYAFILMFICSLIILFDRLLAGFLFSKGFYVAWKYVPFLTMAIVVVSLSGFFGGTLTAAGDSKYAILTVYGAIVNIILNVVLITYFGVQGAAVSTFLSDFIIWILRYRRTKKYITMNINIIRDIIALGLLTIQALLIIFTKNDSLSLIIIELVLIFGIVFLFRRELVIIKNKFVNVIST